MQEYRSRKLQGPVNRTSLEIDMQTFVNAKSDLLSTIKKKCNFHQNLRHPVLSSAQQYWADVLKIHTPLCKIYHKPFTQGVFISDGIALWTLPHDMCTVHLDLTNM